MLIRGHPQLRDTLQLRALVCRERDLDRRPPSTPLVPHSAPHRHQFHPGGSEKAYSPFSRKQFCRQPLINSARAAPTPMRTTPPSTLHPRLRHRTRNRPTSALLMSIHRLGRTTPPRPGQSIARRGCRGGRRCRPHLRSHHDPAGGLHRVRSRPGQLPGRRRYKGRRWLSSLHLRGLLHVRTCRAPPDCPAEPGALLQTTAPRQRTCPVSRAYPPNLCTSQRRLA